MVGAQLTHREIASRKVRAQRGLSVKQQKMVAMDAMQNLSPGKTEELSIFFESSFFLDDEWVLLQLDKPFRQQHPRSLAVMRDLKAWNV
mmetsp:Transcript_36563/g.100922  ORF Transcript_36563/g.100922 Transcript_36563/m.100922 type:complete len:89 (+) Transcript_36563:4069-4335(+)